MLCELLDRSRQRLVLTEAGARKVQREYGWERITSRLVGIYEAVLHEHACRTRRRGARSRGWSLPMADVTVAAKSVGRGPGRDRPREGAV